MDRVSPEIIPSFSPGSSSFPRPDFRFRPSGLQVSRKRFGKLPSEIKRQLYRYFSLNKPFGIQSAFLPGDEKNGLRSLFDFPREVYPLGRLDKESEGLLILTDDPSLNRRLLFPGFGHEREYWAQVEGTISPGAIDSLRNGVNISIGGKSYRTLPCLAEVPEFPISFPPRNPPIRYRKNIPDCWVRLILREGKNRQVRKMGAAVGFPVLRLIRYRIQGITLQGLEPGEVREWKKAAIDAALFP